VAQPYTTIYGLFDRSAGFAGQAPWALTPRWQAARNVLDLSTPLNAVSTNDIIGGNSGSPVVNRKGELVGVIFDGNIDSLVLDIAYDDLRARAVAVDATAIVAALEHVYHAAGLVRELVAGDGHDR
jgi:hypothetical protein